MVAEKCRTCKHSFTTSKDRIYCKKSLADKDDCGEYKRRCREGMTIYVDNGETVKIYPAKAKVAKAVMALLEMDDEMLWCETCKGYEVKIVDKTESEVTDAGSN